jgi:hypothetical protein
LTYLDGVGEVQTLEISQPYKRVQQVYRYRFINQIPLRDTQPSLEVNWCGSVKPRDVVSGQVIKARGLSGVEIASGAEVSGALELVLSAAEATVSRQLALKL